MAQGGGQFVGRVEEIAALDEALARLDEGGSAAIELVGEPGIGKTRLLAELAARADARRAARALGLCVGARAGSAVLGLRRCARRVPAWARPELARPAGRGRPCRARAGLSDPLAAGERPRGCRPARAVSQPPRRAACCSSTWQGTAARARARRPALGRLGVRRAARCAVPSRARGSGAHGAGASAAGDAGASRCSARACRPGRSADADRARRAHARRGERAARRAGRRGPRSRPLRRERRKPVLSRAARPHGRGFGGIRAPGRRRARCPRRSQRRSARSSPCCRRRDASCSKARRSRAIRSSPSWRPPLPRPPRPRRWTAIDELLRLDLVRATDVPRRFRFRHPLVRRAVYEATSAGWRLGAHERCAEALAAAGSFGRGAGTSRRALGARGRCCGRRRPSRGRGGGSSAGSGERRALVRGRSAPPSRDCDCRGAGGSPLRSGGGADRDRPFRRQPRHAAGGDGDRARGASGAAREVARACAGAESLLGRHEEAGGRLSTTLESLPTRARPRRSR